MIDITKVDEIIVAEKQILRHQKRLKYEIILVYILLSLVLSLQIYDIFRSF